MRRLSLGLLSAVSVVAFTHMAAAADLGPPAYKAPPPPVFSWTGCYVGADVGGGWVRDRDFETTTSGATSIFSPAPTNTATPDGVKVGGYLGCDYQFAGGWVVGALGDLQWADIRSGSAQFPNSGSAGITGLSDFYDTKANFEASVRARIGYAFNRLLLYATGGGGWLRVTEQDVLQSEFPVAATADATSTRGGWTVGGGADYAFTDNLIGRVEYRYSDFGTFTYQTPLFPGVIENHKITENQVLVGLHYKFGPAFYP